MRSSPRIIVGIAAGHPAAAGRRCWVDLGGTDIRLLSPRIETESDSERPVGATKSRDSEVSPPAVILKTASEVKGSLAPTTMPQGV